MSASLVSLLLNEADVLLELQRSDGSLPGGRNGGYGDPETPARCTSHAIVSWSYAYARTRNDRFMIAALAALAYLFEVFEQSSGCVVARNVEGKDQSNGVLGQAFVIEAFHSGWSIFGIERARSFGLELIRRHSFNYHRGIWNCVGRSGEVLLPDLTFNHQLYFAAVVAHFKSESSAVDKQVTSFMRHWRQNLAVRNDGRIVHEIPTGGLIRAVARRMLRRAPSAGRKSKELDYHLYNCYAFALLKDAGYEVEVSGHQFWRRITAFVESEAVANILNERNWLAEIRSGTETRVADYCYFRKIFGDPSKVDLGADLHTAARFLRCMIENGDAISPDPVTQRARAYRYWRLVSEVDREGVGLVA